MALPVFTGWSVSHATGISLRWQQMIKMKDMLVATGHWTVAGSGAWPSGGSQSASMSGDDYWDYNASGYNGTSGATGMWCVMECDSVGAAGVQILAQITYGVGIDSSNSTINWYLSASRGFGGTFDWDSRPTASDEILLASVSMKSSLTTDRRIDLWYKTDGSAFRMVPHGPGNLTFNAMLIVEKMTNPRSEMTDNFVAEFINPVISTLVAQGFQTVIDGVVGTVQMLALGNGGGWLVAQTPYAAALPDGEWAIQKVKYWISEAVKKLGLVGECTDWYVCNNAVAAGTTMPSTGEKTHIVYNNVVLPWDGSASWSA